MIDDAERRLREAMPDMSEASGKKKPNAGMLLADIGVFTGFQTADVEAQLRASPGGSAVKRVEVRQTGRFRLLQAAGKMCPVKSWSLGLDSSRQLLDRSCSSDVDFFVPKKTSCSPFVGPLLV